MSVFLVSWAPERPGAADEVFTVQIWCSRAKRLRLDPADHPRAAVQDQQIDKHVLAPSRARPNQETLAVPSGAR